MTIAETRELRRAILAAADIPAGIPLRSLYGAVPANDIKIHDSIGWLLATGLLRGDDASVTVARVWARDGWRDSFARMCAIEDDANNPAVR